MSNLRKVIGVLLLFGVLNPTTASTARADDVYVTSDEIFSFSKYPDTETYSWYSSATISGKPVYQCRLDKGKLNEIRTLTPPIKYLTVTFDTEDTDQTSCPSFYGRLVAISPSGQRVTPDSLTRKDILEQVCDENCQISTTYKTYSYLSCLRQRCRENLFFSYLKFPLGSEPGEWRLELTIYYSQQVTVGSVTSRQNFKKVIPLPETLQVVATSAPTTPTVTTATLPQTTTTAISQTEQPQNELSGKVCKKLAALRTVGNSRFVCARSGKQLRWKPIS